MFAAQVSNGWSAMNDAGVVGVWTYIVWDVPPGTRPGGKVGGRTVLEVRQWPAGTPATQASHPRFVDGEVRP